VLRRTETDEAGGSTVIAEEYAVMDRAGRLQVPREYREALALTRRVRLVLERDHVELWPDHAVRPAAAPVDPPVDAPAAGRAPAPATATPPVPDGAPRRTGRHAASEGSDA
jgi:hypothetical protein